MSTWAVVLLGLIALGSLVQSIVLLGMLRSGLQAARRLREIQDTYEKRLAPAAAEIARIQADVVVLSDLMSRQQARLQEFVESASDKLETTRQTVGPLAKLLGAVALVKGVTKGLRLVRKVKRLL